MALGLKAKLNQIMSASAPAPRAAAGLDERVYAEPFPAELAALGGRSLRRLGLDRPLDWSRALFLDTETTGLGGVGTVAFLVGLGYAEGDRLIVRQYLMRSYADEAALIEKVAAHLKSCDLLISFNGKSFDAPLIESRFVMCRMDSPLSGIAHLDLLHPSRRAWKIRLAQCNLGRLETEILGIVRQGDLPGAEVPERYFEYLRTGDMALLEDVIVHNKRDILSLGALLVRLMDVYDAPADQTDLMDLFSLGRALERQGEVLTARQCYHQAARSQPMTSVTALRSAPYSAAANMNLSLLDKRAGNLADAERLWLQMIARNQMGAWPMVELAKLYEHRRKDPLRALHYARMAIDIETDAPKRLEHEHRCDRLEKKIEKRHKHGTI